MSYIRLLIAFIIPPVAVYMQLGWSRQVALNILLTLLFYVPGLLHAVYIMAARRPGLAAGERFEHPSYPSRTLVPRENADRSVSP